MGGNFYVPLLDHLSNISIFLSSVNLKCNFFFGEPRQEGPHVPLRLARRKSAEND